MSLVYRDDLAYAGGTPTFDERTGLYFPGGRGDVVALGPEFLEGGSMASLADVQGFIDDMSGQAAAWVTALRGPSTTPIVTQTTSAPAATIQGLFAQPLLFIAVLIVLVLLLKA